MKRTGLWRGLTSLMCFLLALSMIAGRALEANAATIDTYLGTQSERVESDGALYDKFKPSDEVLNSDGTGTYTTYGTTGTCTWEDYGTGIIVDDGIEEIRFDLSGSQLVFTVEDSIVYLDKTSGQAV